MGQKMVRGLDSSLDSKRRRGNTERGIPYGATYQDLAVFSQKEKDQKKRHKETKMFAYTSTINMNLVSAPRETPEEIVKILGTNAVNPEINESYVC